MNGIRLQHPRSGLKLAQAAEYLRSLGKYYWIAPRDKVRFKVRMHNGTEVYETTNNIATWRQHYIRLTGELR